VVTDPLTRGHYLSSSPRAPSFCRDVGFIRG
jgi:hypothetical protein